MRWWWLAVLVAWAALVIWRRRQEEPVSGSVRTPKTPRGAQDDGIDREELERAEREVRDMETDARGRPRDDVVGDDWGPGTPKPPCV